MVTIRKARHGDIEAIYTIVYDYALQGLMLHRTREAIQQEIEAEAMFVAEEASAIYGVAGITVFDPSLAEIRSLAVNKSGQGKGIGRKLVARIMEETKQRRIEKLLSLTYQVPFFEKCGFHITQKETMPQKVWKDCIHCAKFTNCDEVAMVVYV